MQLEWETILSYMTADRRWFEDFGRRPPGSEHVQQFRALIPDSWRLRRNGYWLIAEPPDVPAVEQGWKLHVSATSRTAVDTLRLALPILRDAGVSFKFLIDQLAVREVNGKTFPRGASGKFITIYPQDTGQFHAVAASLTAALADFDGPYVLSDRRCPGSRVVSYRYGGFAARSRLDPIGTKELLIRDADGEWVPDIRHPYWSKPAWVDDPFAEERTAEGASAKGLAAGRFVVESAVRFSNRGGIYRGFDTTTGADVILREARPGVEIGPRGIDAVQLLRHEYDILTELADTGLFVRPITYFTQWEHAFIAEEYIEGTHLGQLSNSQNPIHTQQLSSAGLRAYYERFRAIWAQVARAVAVCHERGIVLGDLSPANIMVTPDDRIRIIDMESAFHTGRPESGAGLSTPGMVTRASLETGIGDRRGDYYALGGVLLFCVLPCHQADLVDRDIPKRLFAEVAGDLDLPVELSALITELRDEDAPAPDPASVRDRIATIPFARSWRQPVPLSASPVPADEPSAELRKRIATTLDGVVDYLYGTADLMRTDRLFPADVLVFLTNPLSLAHGAYGCLYTLHTLGREIPDRFLSWALSRSTAASALPPGLYYGAAGVAWAQSALGCPTLAARTLRGVADHPLLFGEAGVLVGAAGYGMACLRLWRDSGQAEFLDQALAVGARLAETAVRGRAPDGDRAYWPARSGAVPIGYGGGAAGVAMFLLALHAATGDESVLALGRAALEYDLSQGEYSPDGVLSFPATVSPDGTPAVVLRHYWDEGTAGILTTALRYHHVTADPGLRRKIDELLPDVRRKYVAFPQLFHGLSGIGNALLDAYEFLGEETLRGDAERAATAVLCTAAERPEGIVFPGEHTARESADLATGGAGVALFLDRLHRTAPGARTNPNFLLDDLLAEP